MIKVEVNREEILLEIFNSLSLEKESSTPLYLQLYKKLKEMIESGILPADAKLPSVRNLAGILNVNQITIVSAFRQLENEGFIYSKPGSGTFVADISLKNIDQHDSYSNSLKDELYLHEDISYISSGRINITENTVNFASATPTPDLFPVDNFKIVMNEVLERDKGNAFSYQESQGYFPLRESIAMLLKSRNLPFDLANIQIISGAQQGIDLISKALLHQNDCIITESPTYTGAIALFKSRGARILDVQMESDGPDMSILEYNLKKYKPRIIYTIPTFQNPTGNSYSTAKRLEILELAEKYNSFIIEDDYVSDLDFEGRGHKPLKALDRYNRVILIKSFSKIFMPGLRLGFMVVPSELAVNLLAAKHITDISTSGLIQRAFDLYIRKGFWDRHFNFMYETYKERYENTTKALENYMPAFYSFNRPGGGLNLWLGLPYGFPINTLVSQAASHDIVFAPGRIFYSGSSPQSLNNIRLSFAAVYTGQIESGVRTLCGLIERLKGTDAKERSVPLL